MKVSRFEWDGAAPRALAGELRGLAAPPEGVSGEVAAIVEDVRRRGDTAVLELTRRFDAPRSEFERLRVDSGEIGAALGGLDEPVRSALKTARDNIEAVAGAQLAETAVVTLDQGHEVRLRELPVTAAGVYAPGGRAAYPSSVLMCCVPAVVAGVARVAVASPPGPDGHVHPVVLAACGVCGVDEVYAMGGAQAIAALALGTESVEAVDVIAGPGNRYVQEAKRQLAGTVGTDAIAGPSELMAIADGSAPIEWLALDICAQAEHGDDGLLVAVASEAGVLERLEETVSGLAAERPSVSDPPFALVRAPTVEDALALADALAPEHLQLMCENANALANSVRTAGCVFVGPGGGTAFGDYAAGSNHVLPTGGAGRFSGALGPAVFRRRMSVVSLPAGAAGALAPHVGALARAEGFPVHGESAEARSEVAQ